MEVKKSPKADLEKNKTLYILIGYVMILAVIFVAFEWSDTEVKKMEDTSGMVANMDEEIMPVTIMETPPPPPPPPAPAVEEILNIVDDDTKIEQVEIESLEDKQDNRQDVHIIGPPSDGGGEEAGDTQIFIVAENMPEFPGGQAALMRYLANNIKYPEIARENGIQGRVTLQFVVNKDGKISDITILRGVDPSMDKEAIRVVQSMPAWTPGKQRGLPVRVKFTLPVTFRLQ